MATTIEYALMVGASYIPTRPEINRFPAPNGWLGNQRTGIDFFLTRSGLVNRLDRIIYAFRHIDYVMAEG